MSEGNLYVSMGDYIATFLHYWKRLFINILVFGQSFNTSKSYHIKES